ncbi:MAG TPA: hypothetical protein PKI93_00975 [Alphaproteobacteria bacterium]|nr:hypothetical protein [Alphaproteobacteria bacterium]
MTKAPKSPDDDKTDPSNPFHLIKVMVGASVGKMPAGLVILLVLALAAASAAGLALKYARGEQDIRKGEVRLAPSAGAVETVLANGVWAAAHKHYVMSFSIVRDRFEWIVIDNDSPNIRYFARGEWKLDFDVLSLTQRKDMGYASDPDNRQLRFIPIPFDDFEMRLSGEGKKMVWSIPESEYSRIEGLLGELFDNAPQTDIVWSLR